MQKLLFVCLGNICRSPAAEAIMNHLIAEADLQSKVVCDSAGTAASHHGESADARMIKHATKRGYKVTSISRPLCADDLEEYDYILAMDDSNYDDILALDHGDQNRHKILRMTSFRQKRSFDHVPDPYYGGSQGFELVLDILEDSCRGLLDKLTAQGLR